LASVRDWIDEVALVLDDELKVTSANAAAARALGRPSDELVGKPLGAILPEADREPLGSKLRDAIEARRDVAFDVRLEGTPYAGAYSVSLLAHDQGVTALLRRLERTASAHNGSDGGAR